MAAQRRVQQRMLATRERLVKCALALFAKHGIYQTTVENITEAADVGKGTFYEHFASKTAIIQYLLHEGFQDLLSRCRQEAQAGATSRDRVKRLLWAQLRFFSERRDLLILFHQARGLLKLQPEEARSLQREYDRYVRFLKRELETTLDRRWYSRETAWQMACAMAGFVTGYLSYLVITGMSKDGANDMTIPARIFLEGIAGKGLLD